MSVVTYVLTGFCCYLLFVAHSDNFMRAVCVTKSNPRMHTDTGTGFLKEFVICSVQIVFESADWIHSASINFYKKLPVLSNSGIHLDNF